MENTTRDHILKGTLTLRRCRRPPPYQVISALLQTMKDQSNPRVQAHAAAALINFTEDCPKSLLIPYLDSLVQHLHVIMVAKLQEVQFVRINRSKESCSLVPADTLYSSERQPVLRSLKCIFFPPPS